MSWRLLPREINTHAFLHTFYYAEFRPHRVYGRMYQALNSLRCLFGSSFFCRVISFASSFATNAPPYSTWWCISIKQVIILIKISLQEFKVYFHRRRINPASVLLHKAYFSSINPTSGSAVP